MNAVIEAAQTEIFSSKNQIRQIFPTSNQLDTDE